MDSKIENFVRQGIQVLDAPPEGWKLLQNTNTEPIGYRWYCNGKSRFGGGHRHALVMEQQ